jgi:hypothetical protein
MEEGERIKNALVSIRPSSSFLSWVDTLTGTLQYQVKAMFASLVDEAIYEVAVAAHKIQLKQNGPCAACGQE